VEVSVNTERLREFYARAGYRLAQTTHADWYVPGARIYRNVPPGHPVEPIQEEITELLTHAGMLGVEFANGLGIGVPSGRWVLRDAAYDLSSLQRQFRQHVVHALAREQVQEIGFDDLCRLGMTANRETLQRQQRRDRHFWDPTLWRQLCDAGRCTPGAGVFASIGPLGLTAYLVYFIVGDTCHGLFAKSCTAARHTGANHALYYTYSFTMIRRPPLAVLTLGPQGLPPIETVERFKRHAGYHLEPHHLAVLLRPTIRTLVLSRSMGCALWAGERLLGVTETSRRLHALRQALRSPRACKPQGS
jgi:hypothetical protein